VWRCELIFRKSRSHIRITGVRRMTWSRFHTEDPNIIGVTVQNVVSRVTWRPGFVHP